MGIICEHGGPECFCAGCYQDILRWKRDAAAIECPSQSCSFLPDLIGGRDIDEDVKKCAERSAHFFDFESALDLESHHAACGEVSLSDPMSKHLHGIHAAAQQADVDIAIDENANAHGISWNGWVIRRLSCS